MKQKGLVMEISGQNVILLTEDGQFISRRISGSCPQIGDEINIEEEKQKQKGFWTTLKILGVAAVLMAAVFAGKLWHQSQIPLVASEAKIISYITVDINPSVELGLDKDEIVVSVNPLNKDAAIILKDLSLEGLAAEEAVEMVIDAAAKGGYLAPEKENQVIINISENTPEESQKETKEPMSQTIPKKAEKTLAEKNINAKIEVIKTDLDLREKAQELGISAGKYAILVEAKEAGLNVDLKSIKKSGVTKAIKEAGGEPEKIIKSAKEEINYSEKINKWQQQLKESKKLIEEEEKKNKDALKDIKKSWKEKEKKSDNSIKVKENRQKNIYNNQQNKNRDKNKDNEVKSKIKSNKDNNKDNNKVEKDWDKEKDKDRDTVNFKDKFKDKSKENDNKKRGKYENKEGYLIFKYQLVAL